jgi:hypothetical protein
MTGAGTLKPFADDLVSQFRPIAVTAQVTEIEMAEVGSDDLFGGIGSGFVGKMTVAAEDALLDAPRAFGVVLEQLEVVICLEHEGVR